MPTQLPVVPANVKVQDFAASVVVPGSDFTYLYGLVGPLLQPVAGDGRVITLASGGVEAPVFGYAKSGVVMALARNVLLGCGDGSYLQHEVGRLALMLNGVTVLLNRQCPIDVEGDKEIRDSVPFTARSLAHRDFAQHYGGVQVTEMSLQDSLVGRSVQVNGILHIVPGREVRERLN